jgi:hypothetical protein
MRLKHTLFALPLAALLATGCSSDTIGPDEITVADLVGTWKITKIEYVADAGSNTVDLIKDNNVAATITVLANGAYTETLTVPGVPATTITGNFTVQNGTIVNSQTGNNARNVEVTREGDKITFVDEGATFDFDNNATTPDTGADLTMIWEKQ